MTTLQNIKSRLLAALEDPAGSRFSDSMIETAIRQALEEIDLRLPRVLTTEVEITTGGRDQSIPPLPGMLYLVDLAFADGENTAISFEPEVQFTYLLAGNHAELHFCGVTFPVSGSTLTVRYAARNTLEDLDDAAETTLPEVCENTLVNGAAGHACLLRASALSESYNSRPGEPARLLETARIWMELFEHALTGVKVLQDFGFPAGFPLDAWETQRG
jgi:hypothetical protein